MPEKFEKNQVCVQVLTPTLSFPSFFLQGKPVNKNKDFCPYSTPKIPGKEGKNALKNKEVLTREKDEEFPKSKERKDRVIAACCEVWNVRACESLGSTKPKIFQRVPLSCSQDHDRSLGPFSHSGGNQCGPREMEPFVLLVSFPCLYYCRQNQYPAQKKIEELIR